MCHIKQKLFDDILRGVLFIVTLGTHLLNDEANPNTQTLATSTYYLHPDFNPQTLANDIGLVELRMPVQWTRMLKKIYLF